MDPIYCSNDPCEAEAEHYYFNESGEKIYLCYPCSNAFEWGQNNPGADLFSANDTEEE